MPKEALTPTLSHKERAKRLGRSLALHRMVAQPDSIAPPNLPAGGEGLSP